MHSTVFTLATLFVLLASAPALAGQTVTVREGIKVGHPADSVWTAPFAINNRGVIVGVSDTAEGVSRAFVWTSRTGFELIAENALAWDINNRGQVVGEQYGATATTGFLWTRKGGFTNLGPFIPYAINDRGLMAGVCLPDGNPCVRRNGLLTPLHTAQGAAWDINARGDVAGAVGDNAYWWTAEGEAVDLGPGLAEGINNRRIVAGSHRPEGTILAPTLWTRRGIVTLPSTSGAAIGINARGWVLVHTGGHPLVWNSKNGALAELRSSRGLAFPFDMNGHGDVVGIVDVAGEIHVAVWRVRARHLNRRR